MAYQAPQSFYFKLELPSQLKRKEKVIARADFLEKISNQLFKNDYSFLGLQEGVYIPSQKLYETGAASEFSDPLLNSEKTETIFYFDNLRGAELAAQKIKDELMLEDSPVIFDQPAQDWHETWRREFKGHSIPPYWNIRPTWQEGSSSPLKCDYEILLNPGMGFGAGTHGTTELCLKVLGSQPDLKTKHVLDFGAGSGILAIAAAKKGAQVIAIEIDDMALDGAATCAEINRVDSQITWRKFLDEKDREFDLILANILAPVLKEFANELIGRLKPEGRIFLSGLLETDVSEIQKIYSSEFKKSKGREPETHILSQNEWQLIEFKLPQE